MNKLSELLGIDQKSKDIANLFEDFNETPEIWIDDDSGYKYYSFKKNGIEFVFDDSLLLTSIFLYCIPDEDFECYKGELPEKINLDISPKGIREKFGDLIKRGSNKSILDPRQVDVWEIYKIDNGFVHFTFNNDFLIKVTLMQKLS